MKICVIGASGIGKSTLIEGILRCAKDGRLLDTDAAKRSITGRYAGFSIQNKVIRAISRILPGKPKKLITEFLFREIARSVFRSLATPYAALFEAGYSGFSGVPDPVARMKMASFFYKIAQEEILIDRYVPDAAILYDDSIFQLLRGFGGSSDSLLPHTGTAGIPDAVIYCSTPWSVARERLAERTRKGRTNTAHYLLDEEGLEKAFAEESENARAKIEFFNARGIPVHVVDLSGDSGNAAEKAVSFINGLVT